MLYNVEQQLIFFLQKVNINSKKEIKNGSNK